MLLDRDSLGRNALGHVGGWPVFAAEGAFVETGGAATFQALEAAAGGSFAFTGEPANFQAQLAAGRGNFAATGIVAAFGAVLAAPFGAFILAGKASIDLDAEVAACGLFSLTSAGAFLSYELLGGGGTIVAGTFSRGRWRALQEEIAAEQAAQRAARAADKRRRRAQAQAAAQAER